jgi:hypothetical protein
MDMNNKLLLGVVTGLLLMGMAGVVSATPVTDTLENIGLDGTAVTSRVIGGVTVDISTSTGADMMAYTYFDNAPVAFKGANGGNNAPLNPGNVSGTRFISTSEVGSIGGLINIVQPISFDFSTPVSGFGLTTLDMLESAWSNTDNVRLVALDANGQIIDSQLRTGPQGASGIDLGWFVQSAQAEITKAVLFVSNNGTGAAYGIDDLVVDPAQKFPLPVPEPTTIFLLGCGFAWACWHIARNKIRC